MQEADLYLIVGLTALLVFAIQTAMTFIGGDGGDGLGDDHGDFDSGDLDSDGSGDDHGDSHEHDSNWSFLRFFTLRNLSAFALGYGFTGYAGLKSGFPSFAAALAGLAAGFVFVWAIYKLMKILYSLESDGAVDPRQAIGLTAEVYLEIEENSPGKIMALLGGAKRELPAMHPHPGRLERGTIVRIIDYDGNYYTVERA